MYVDLELFGYHFKQLLFYFFYRFAHGKFGAIRYAINVGVHCNGRPAKRGVEHHISRFSANAGQGFECLTTFRYFTTMLFNQDLAKLMDVLCFLIKQTNGFDVIF